MAKKSKKKNKKKRLWEPVAGQFMISNFVPCKSGFPRVWTREQVRLQKVVTCLVTETTPLRCETQDTVPKCFYRYHCYVALYSVQYLAERASRDDPVHSTCTVGAARKSENTRPSGPNYFFRAGSREVVGYSSSRCRYRCRSFFATVRP